MREEEHLAMVPELLAQLKGIGLKVVEDYTTPVFEDGGLETRISCYLHEITDETVDESTDEYIPVYENTLVCKIVVLLGEVVHCSLSDEYAITGSNLAFELLSKLYKILAKY